MKEKLGVALAIAIITLLTYFLFPGHTYLTQDTQIYVPILEHLWDSSVLTRDILVERPHVAFTLYDEVAVALRWLTHSGFHAVLAAQQIVFRGLGIWGTYLLAVSALKSTRMGLLVAAVCALGAEVPGPAVLVTEYEPSPRAFAVPLLFLAMGLLARRRYSWTGIALSIAFLYHPPSTYPFWIGLPFVLNGRALRAVALPLAFSLAVLLTAAHFQAGIAEQQVFFSRINPQLEALQRFRAPYDWISLWWPREWIQYLFLTAVCLAALWRTRGLFDTQIRAFLIALTAIGLASVPVSYLLLDRLKWGLMPQLQPARALLFLIAIGVLAAAVAACAAARDHRWPEAVAWFGFAFAVPVHARIDSLPPVAVASAVFGLAVFSFAAAGPLRFATPLAALAGFFAIPLLAHIQNYPLIDNPDLRALSAWARTSTRQDAVFLFPSPSKNLEPGVFRSEALRAIYVDWKGGGQINYLKELGEEWWTRYQATILHAFTPADLSRYAQLGIDYVVLSRPLDRAAVYENGRYAVYRTAR